MKACSLARKQYYDLLLGKARIIHGKMEGVRILSHIYYSSPTAVRRSTLASPEKPDELRDFLRVIIFLAWLEYSENICFPELMGCTPCA